jgi:hypothetical protein
MCRQQEDRLVPSMRALVAALVLLLPLGGCTSVADTTNLLVQAGFAPVPPNGPAPPADLPPNRLVMRDVGGRMMWFFADPEYCRCVYAGGEAEHQQFRRLQSLQVLDTVNRANGPSGASG